MRNRTLYIVVLIFAAVFVCSRQDVAAQEAAPLAIIAGPSNDLCRTLAAADQVFSRYDTVQQAIEAGQTHRAICILAEHYPTQTTTVSAAELRSLQSMAARIFIEYCDDLPGIEFSAPQGVRWERGFVIADDSAVALPKHRILSLQDCQYLPVQSPKLPMDQVLLGIGRIAGFNHAVYGLPVDWQPILFQADEGLLVATTQLSHFITARYAPSNDWIQLWEGLLQYLAPRDGGYHLVASADVHPWYSRDETLPLDAQQQAVAHGAGWFINSRLLIPADREQEIHTRLLEGAATISVPSDQSPVGDGTLGILEGYASQILPDGSQLQSLAIRADCQAESAAALAIHAKLSGDQHSKQVATNLLNYLYFTSELHQGVRSDPDHPSYGLIAWGAIAPAWQIGNYGDDNARTLLASIIASSSLESSAWDESILLALYANLRTTGQLGFRGDRVDVGPLEANGWKAFQQSQTLNLSPFFESYLWACYLWAFDKTQDQRFLETATRGIRTTMDAYPDSWRWADNLDRCRMVLALAWLVRVQDTAEHRQWLQTVAADLLRDQQACGAIPEQLSITTAGHYVAPQSNEAYGTSETPLIQSNGDPVSDQLYVSSFALLGLREAVAATHDETLAIAEQRLADYLVRIQVRSEKVPYLNGTWFRAFDYDRWDYWSSSGDLGWGAWCAESGWGPAWTCITLGLRVQNTSFWDATRSSKIQSKVAEVQSKIEVE